jgi:hypothetical protein
MREEMSILFRLLTDAIEAKQKAEEARAIEQEARLRAEQEAAELSAKMNFMKSYTDIVLSKFAG